MKSDLSTHIHIIGICGTFMGSLALLARSLGYRVSGSDQNIYPPMSTQLLSSGIEMIEGYHADQLPKDLSEVIIGNAVSRGNALVEHVLNKGVPYTSGPEWLSRNLLQNKWVLAVSGTHGKTTTTSMLAWILEYAGLKPGFLIGGVPKNFDYSARLGESDFFVIEADEYDSAFFDKRSKFVHYKPRTLVINNLEFDHADIFKDLSAIQTQFHHLIRTVPSDGLIITPYQNKAVDEVIKTGCWSPVQTFSTNDSSIESVDLKTNILDPAANTFEVIANNKDVGTINWQHSGLHNINNALSALLAAHHVGVRLEEGIEALNEFQGVARRMETIATSDLITVYDDFAHHPSAINSTIQGLRAKVGNETIKVIIEPRSNTMKMGVHQTSLQDCFDQADEVIWFNPGTLKWSLESITKNNLKHHQFHDVTSILDHVFKSTDNELKQHWVIMSNGSFGGIYQMIKSKLGKLEA